MILKEKETLDEDVIVWDTADTEAVNKSASSLNHTTSMNNSDRMQKMLLRSSESHHTSRR